jgi:hypothetical protein
MLTAACNFTNPSGKLLKGLRDEPGASMDRHRATRVKFRRHPGKGRHSVFEGREAWKWDESILATQGLRTACAQLDAVAIVFASRRQKVCTYYTANH